MLTFDSLMKQPARFQNFTGLKVAEAQKLLTLLQSDWDSQRSRSFKTNRVRKIGGGRKLELPDFKDRLLVFLVYAKLYPTYVFLEYLFGADHTTVGRIIKELEPILSATIIINRHHKRIRSLKDLKEVIPDLDEVIIDATEQKIPRPEKKKARKKHHSGKRKDFTLKEQIMGTKQKLVLHVSNPVPGRMHDYKLFQKSGIPEWLTKHPEVTGRFDSGYQGAQKDYPKATIVLPVKRSRSKHELTRSEKIMNTKKAKQRIWVENILANLKKFKILKDIYRNGKERYGSLFKAIVFLSNFRTLARMPV